MDAGPADALELARALNEMKPVAIWAFVLMFFFLVAYLVIIQIIKARREKRQEDAKEARALSYTSTIGTLVSAINKQITEIHSFVSTFGESLDTIEEVSEKTQQTMGRVEKVVNTLKDRFEEKMSFQDSLRLIDTYFHRIEASAIEIIRAALVENHYRSRREFVSKRVRTDISSFIDLMCSDLSEYRLFFSYAVFLATYAKDGADGGDRYILCDKIWAAVEHLFENEDNSPVDLRIQEARLLTINAIRDLYSHTARKVMRRHSQGRPADMETAYYTKVSETAAIKKDATRTSYSRTPSNLPDTP